MNRAQAMDTFARYLVIPCPEKGCGKPAGAMCEDSATWVHIGRMVAVQDYIDAGLDAGQRLGYSEHGDALGYILRHALTDEDRARDLWSAAFPHDPDSFAVIMADAREARAAAERRAAL